MAKAPFTGGKNAVSPGSTGKFSGGTGGHTARGVHKPATDSKATKGSPHEAETNRIGKLNFRVRGNAGAFKKDHYGI